MKDYVIAGIAVAGLVPLAVVSILLYIVISYKRWKGSPDADKRKYCLNNSYKHYQQNREMTRVNEENKRNLKVSIATEDAGLSQDGGHGNRAFSMVNYNKSSGVVINQESVTLEVPRSPIRKSAETYSVVDLNDDI